MSALSEKMWSQYYHVRGRIAWYRQKSKNIGTVRIEVNIVKEGIHENKNITRIMEKRAQM